MSIVLKMVMIGLIFVASLCFGIFLVKYLKDYKIFPMIYSKIMGHAAEADRIRRMQMREAFQKNTDILSQTSSDKGPKLIEKIYRKISMTGVSSVIPGFSESSFLVVTVVFGLILYAAFTLWRNSIVGLFVFGAYIVSVLYLMNVAAYRRKIKVESQLLDFVNTIATASRQYSNLVDILGSTYENFTGPLSKAMEECYIEARSINNNELAIQHMKDKFDSVQFAFVLDNLLLCSKETGDYFGVATDISKTISIYIASYEKKQAILRNAKLTLSIMVALTMGIVYALGMFLGGVLVLISSTGGIIVVVMMILLYLYGMNMRVE